MKYLLILIITIAALAGCVRGDADDCEECVTTDELLDVVICLYYNPLIGDNYTLIAMLPDGSVKKVIYTPGGCSMDNPMIGCDGETVVFVDFCNQNLYTLYIPDNRLHLLYQGDDCCSAFSNPVFSPDMQEIFVLKMNNHLSVFTLSTGLLTDLYQNEYLSPPSITADGDHLVFAGVDRRINVEMDELQLIHGIFTMDPDQRNLKMVREFGPIEGDTTFTAGISVIPATSEIIYSLNIRNSDDPEDEGVYNVYKTSLNGAGETFLFSSDEHIYNLSSNRRGDQILFFCGCYDSPITIAHFQDNILTNISSITLPGMDIGASVFSPRFTVINRDLFNSLPDLIVP